MRDEEMYVCFVVPPGAGEIMFQPEYEVAKYMVPGDTCEFLMEDPSGLGMARLEFTVTHRKWDSSELRIHLVE